MPRVTRSQVDAIDHFPKPATPLAERNLAMGVNTIDDEVLASELKGLKAAYRGALGIAKRGRKARNKKKDKQEPYIETQEIVIEQAIEDKPANSLSVEATCQLRPTCEEQTSISVQQIQTPAPIGRTTRRQAAQAQAAEKASFKSLGQNITEIYDDTENQVAQHVFGNEQSSLPLEQTSPVKTLAEVEDLYGPIESCTPTSEGEDSFVEQITSRSPAKPVTRIEDSLEALDQLEEALEAIGEVALVETFQPQEKMRENPHTPKARPGSLERAKSMRTTKPEAMAPGPRKHNSVRAENTRPGYSSVRVKPTAPKSASIIKKATSMIFNCPDNERRKIEEPIKAQAPSKITSKRPTSLLPPKEPVKSAKPLTRPTFELPGEAISRKLKEQREARLAQRLASEENCQSGRSVSQPRHKSTKPPTKATFELPGEALSRRKKEAQEARIKAQEEEERQRREFRAKPVPRNILPDYIPRDTVASRARQSKVSLENADVGELTISKRNSTTGANIGAHRSSNTQLNQANISAPRVRPQAPVRKQAPISSQGPSMSGRVMLRTVTANDVQVQRQRAKEIYERDAKMTEDMEREKREREAAAKRAREEAAERGRQASREWAEKQMARKMADNDRMGQGFGPGGQLGLTA